jgi:hypothetical protein
MRSTIPVLKRAFFIGDPQEGNERHLAAFLLAIVAVPSSMAEVPEYARVAINRTPGAKGYSADEGVY